MNKKVIIDVDTGVDDALGLLLAIRSGELDILGITTVNGNVSMEQATANTCKILQLAGAEHIPVVQGAGKPMIRSTYFEHRVHGKDGLGGALDDMTQRKQPEEGYAVDFIIEQIREHHGEITLIMTGPLTNLALAILKYPELVQQVKEVVVMGGVVQSFGNVTPTAEYNMYVDPEAAKHVFWAGFASLTLVGLDVTRKALLSEEHINAMGDSEIARYVRASTADYMKRYQERNGVKACAMHDPLAVAVAINPDLVKTGHYYVDIETRSELCDGQTVCDFQNRLAVKPNVHVCLEVAADEFINHFIRVLRG
ncbi:nucleoside hydrolase [Paenibacillus sp. GCM10012307]|uniref:nucleoside hydrolase n=1 Tax=Paenibacillus TaxID=44249 RepID=UPI001E58624D|nr:nucleoside hydrolase [Paenibacillus roseus]